MNERKIYQEAKCGNCVFVGYDRDKNSKYCSMRAARTESDFKQDHRLSIGCTWDGALERYMKDHPEIKKIVFALDNDFNVRDKDGKRAPNYGQVAAEKYCEKYGEQGYACAIHLPHLKDFNTDLTETRKGKSSKELDAMRVSILEAEFESEAWDEPEEESEDELEP